MRARMSGVLVLGLGLGWAAAASSQPAAAPSTISGANGTLAPPPADPGPTPATPSARSSATSAPGASGLALAVRVGAAYVELSGPDVSLWGPFVDAEVGLHASDRWDVVGFGGFTSIYQGFEDADLHVRMFDVGGRATLHLAGPFFGAGVSMNVLVRTGGGWDPVQGYQMETDAQVRAQGELHAGYQFGRISGVAIQALGMWTCAVSREGPMTWRLGLGFEI